MRHDAKISPSATVQFWNSVLAPKFVRYRHILVGGLSRHTEVVFPDLEVPSGGRVADIGCGFGDTSIELARRVGPDGHVTGIDICDDFLAIARHDQESAGIRNLEFLVCDVERALPLASYDFVFSRFGTMFFNNPVVAFRNMARTLRQGGHLTHIVWRAREDNPWLSAARQVLLDHLPSPDDGEPNCGPGPFSMAQPGPLKLQMEAAGFRDIEFERIDAQVMVGRDVEEAVAFQLAIGPAGEVFRAAGMEAEAKRQKIEDDLRVLFRGQPSDASGIWMNSSSWVVRARVSNG